MKNSHFVYGSVAKTLHWLIAISVILLLIMGFMLGSFKDKNLNDSFYMLHKSIGLIVLILMLLRIMWRFVNIEPLLTHVPLWQQRTAHLSHDLFYLLLIIMPLSGWIMSVTSGHSPVFFNLFTVPLPLEKSKFTAEWAKQIHNTLAWVIIALLSIHVLAALKHYFINKDDVFQRMLPATRRQKASK